MCPDARWHVGRARDHGLGGRESPVELDAAPALLARLEALRRAVGEAMGLGTVVNSGRAAPGERRIAVLQPQGRIEVDVLVCGHGDEARSERDALVRTARKIMQGELHLPA